MTRLHKRDSNHQEIKRAFERLDWSVLDTADLGHGAPDMVCGHGDRCVLVEVKSPGGVFTDDEIAFQLKWKGPYFTVRCIEDVLRIVEGR